VLWGVVFGGIRPVAAWLLVARSGGCLRAAADLDSGGLHRLRGGADGRPVVLAVESGVDLVAAAILVVVTAAGVDFHH
jgi:hypothetical protein